MHPTTIALLRAIKAAVGVTSALDAWRAAGCPNVPAQVPLGVMWRPPGGYAIMLRPAPNQGAPETWPSTPGLWVCDGQVWRRPTDGEVAALARGVVLHG